MKIVSWNCHYGFCKDKARIIDETFPDADIFVIQECTKSDIDSLKFTCKYKNWYGDDLDDGSELGIGIFSKTHEVEFTQEFNRNFRYVVPYRVKLSNTKSFVLFVVWTKSQERGRFYYEKNIIEAIGSEIYQNLFSEKVLMIGDFNTFAKNEEELRKFEDKMKPLINCADPQFRNKNTYHHSRSNTDGIDDFCFASENLMKKKMAFDVCSGWDKSWNGSDHCPISVEFEL